MATNLTKLDQATRMLAEIRTVDDAKQLIDLAEAARVYARQVDLGLEAQNHAAEIKLRAQRRAGEVLQEMDKAKGAAEPGWKTPFEPQRALDKPPTYAELDIRYSDAHNWQTIAAMPEEDFEAHIAEVTGGGKELTTAGIVRAAKHQPPHVSHNAGNNEWYTPPKYIEAVREVLGHIDLDPASTPEANEVVGADKFYTAQDDGLQMPWCGRVFMNPPYASDLIPLFASKLKQHVLDGDITEAIILVNNATETGWFQSMAVVAQAICFPLSRIRFWGPDGEVGSPLQGQAILYFGPNRGKFSEGFSRFGIILWR